MRRANLNNLHARTDAHPSPKEDEEEGKKMLLVTAFFATRSE